MKNSSDGIGNRNRDLLTCRAGPKIRKTEPIGDRVLTELKVLKVRGKITERTRQKRSALRNISVFV